MDMEKILEFKENIYWLGHAGFLIKYAGKNIYFDPFRLDKLNVREFPKADIVLISHSHYDHCSLEDLQKIVNEESIIVCPADCQSSVARLKIKEMIPVSPGKELDVEGIKIYAVPAYNINKHFHPKENEWVGYIVDFGGTTLYHAGDTDYIPEMENFSNITTIDIALLPVSGTYVMTAQEAAEAFKAIKAKVAVPMHYGEIVGDEKDKETFIQLVGGDKVIEVKKFG